MRWVIHGIGLVNTVVLARVLSPDDFGLMAMAGVVVEFLMMLSDTSVDIALIRDPKAQRSIYDSAWTVQVISGLAVTLLVLAVIPLLVTYYRDPRVATVMYIIALRPAIQGFENVGVVEFRKSLNFAKEFRYWIFRRLSMVVVALVLALTLRNYVALAISSTATALVTVIFSFAMSSFRPRFSLAAARRFWGASRWMIMQNVSQTSLDRVDEFIIGGVSTSTAVGNYYVASQVAPMPTREIAWPVERALMPTYSKITGNMEELSRTILAVMGLMAIICIPIGAGLMTVADDFVHTVFGDKWSAAIPFFRWLAIFGIFAGLGRPLMPMFYALKRERLYASLCATQVAVLVPVLIVAIKHFDLVAVAMGRTVVAGVFFVIFCIVTTRIINVRLLQIAAVLWRPAVAAFVMVLGVKEFHDAEISTPLISLIRDCAVGAILYPVLLGLVWLLAGRPVGPERLVAAQARALFVRIWGGK